MNAGGRYGARFERERRAGLRWSRWFSEVVWRSAWIRRSGNVSTGDRQPELCVCGIDCHQGGYLPLRQVVVGRTVHSGISANCCPYRAASPLGATGLPRATYRSESDTTVVSVMARQRLRPFSFLPDSESRGTSPLQLHPHPAAVLLTRIENLQMHGQLRTDGNKAATVSYY